MELTMSQCLDLEGLYTKLQDKALPIPVLYKLSKFFKAVKEENQYYRDQISQLIRENAEYDEEGNIKIQDGNYVIKDDKRDEFVTKANELMSIKPVLPDITFTAEDFEKADLTLNEFSLLLPIIKD